MGTLNDNNELTFRGTVYKVESRFSDTGTLREVYEAFLIESQRRAGRSEGVWEEEKHGQR